MADDFYLLFLYPNSEVAIVTSANICQIFNLHLLLTGHNLLKIRSFLYEDYLKY